MMPVTFSTTEWPAGPSLTLPVTARPPSGCRESKVPLAKTTSGAVGAGAAKWPDSEISAAPVSVCDAPGQDLGGFEQGDPVRHSSTDITARELGAGRV